MTVVALSISLAVLVAAQEPASSPAPAPPVRKLRVSVMADDPANAIVRSELEAAGFIAVGCSENHFACLEPEQKCMERVRHVCGEDVVVGLDVRKESDGVWRKTVVVDADGAVVLSLDQPADGNTLLTPIALETLRGLPVPEPAPIADPPPSHVHEEIRYGEGSLSPIFWAGVIAAGAGVVGAGVAATFAGIAEAERAEPSALANARVEAGERARLLWFGAGAGAVVAVTGAAAACINSDTRVVAPQYRRWCIE